jgi:hypothetical protein
MEDKPGGDKEGVTAVTHAALNSVLYSFSVISRSTPKTGHLMAAISLPLSKMSLSQKMDVMERVWSSMVSNDSKFESPAWHLDVLKERERLVAAGKAKFSDWSEAKERIRKQVKARAA